jgi:hypothetical protein
LADLAETQHQFATALLDASAPLPAAIRAHGKNAPEKRFAVYRNNVVSSLISALAARFPVVQRLVGEEFFRAMARVYVVEEPPRSPVLLQYGDTFPGFLENFAPAAEIEYLADVARLELARGRAYHAADAMPIDAAVLALLAPEELDGLRLALHPSVSLLESPFPIVSIWEAHQAAEVAPVREWGPEAALVARPALEVEVWRLPPGGYSLMSRLAGGTALAAAAEAASAATTDFDLVANLTLLLRANVVVALERAPAALDEAASQIA